MTLYMGHKWAPKATHTYTQKAYDTIIKIMAWSSSPKSWETTPTWSRLESLWRWQREDWYNYGVTTLCKGWKLVRLSGGWTIGSLVEIMRPDQQKINRRVLVAVVT